MKAFNNTPKKKLLQSISFIYLFLFLAACTNNHKPEQKHTKTSALQDSITTWVTHAKNKKFSKEKRLAFLEKAYLKNKEQPIDTNTSKTLSDISLAYSNLKDSLWFRKTNRETIKVSLLVNDSTSLANSYWDLSLFFKRNAVMDSAYYYAQKSQKIFTAKKNFVSAGRLFNQMGAIQESIKDNTGAEINAIKAVELLKPLKEYKHLSNAYNQLGIINNNLGEYDKSITYYKEAINYGKKVESKNNNSPLHNIGVVYLAKKEYANAKTYFKQTLEVTNPKSSLYATALTNLARCNFNLGIQDSVETNYIKALNIRTNLGDLYRTSASHYYLGEYYLSLKDTPKAHQQAKQALHFAEESVNNERVLKSLELLALTNPQKAAEYRLKHINLTDSLQIEERKIRNKFARIRFETDEFIAENILLEREKQLWTGIAIGLVLLTLAIYIIVTQRSKNQKLRFNQEQQAKNQEVFNLMLAQKQKVEEAKRQEQKRISEELHDGVLGKMLGARMVLTGLNKKVDLEAIAEKAKAIVALKDAEGEVRSISHELSHSAYQKIPNFINSITELLESQAKNAKIEQDFNFDNTMDWDTLSGDIKINVYRMIQECITNSIKHANCAKVYVNFEIHNSNFEVTVGDDGQGYELSKEKKGIGLRNIKSRMEKLNGHFTVDTAPGRGTSFFFNIPVSDVSQYEENEIPV